MSRWANLIRICGGGSLCILFLIAIQQHGSLESQFSTEPYNTSVTINRDILIEQRQLIRQEMKNFKYSSDRFRNDAKKLTDLIIETNGKPVRSIIISTWRSGTTFLGAILNSMPGNYYHYEPLCNFGIKQIRGDEDYQNTMNNIIKLLKCDYSNMSEYIEYGKTHSPFFQRNERLWLQYTEYSPLLESKFLTSFCKLFPLQSMKIVRLRLALAEILLSDESLNVRLLFLVRDPRGTMQSRKHLGQCSVSPDCSNATFLCTDLITDYAAAEYLLKKYPSRFMTIRYEDLSLNPYNMTEEILQFYGLPFHPLVKKFLETHTKFNQGDLSSTYRNSKTAPFHWIKDLTLLEIQTIELSCKKAMSLWGYRQLKSSDYLTSKFDPLIIPSPFPRKNFNQQLFRNFFWQIF